MSLRAPAVVVLTAAWTKRGACTGVSIGTSTRAILTDTRRLGKERSARGRGRRRSWASLRLVSALKDGLDVGCVAGANASVLRAEGSLPEHDTTEHLGVLLLVEFDQLVRFDGLEVRGWVVRRSALVGRKPDVQLHVGVDDGVLLEPGDPVVEGEGRGGSRDTFVSSSCIAFGGVVKLDEDKVEVGLADGIGKSGVGNLALRCARDVEVPWLGREVHVLPPLNQAVVVGEQVVVKWSWLNESLKVKIETIDVLVAERTGFSLSHPLIILGSEGTPQEVGEVFSDVRGFQVVFDGVATTD